MKSMCKSSKKSFYTAKANDFFVYFTYGYDSMKVYTLSANWKPIPVKKTSKNHLFFFFMFAELNFHRYCKLFCPINMLY